MALFPFVRQKEFNRVLKELTELRESSLNMNWDMYKHTFVSTEDAGVTLTKSNVTSLSAVYSALNILADTLNIPINVYKIDDKFDNYPVDKSDAFVYQIYTLLHKKPNDLHTPAQWIQIMEYSRNIYGNAISYIVRDRFGVPQSLRFVPWNQVEITYDGVRLWYTLKDEQYKPIVKDAPAWDVIHVKTLSADGILGMSPIDQAKESLAFGKATQQTGNRFFANGMTSKVVLSHPGVLKPDAAKTLQSSFDEKMKSGKTLVLEEGLKPTLLTITPEQSQFIQSREFSVTEISRWFNIPKFMLANDEPTYSNIENFALHFITHNVRPRVRIYEQEFNTKLLGNDPEYFTEFNMDALLRADLKSQAEYFTRATGGNSWMNRNEVRKLKNLNATTGGDEFLSPLNMATDAERKTKINGDDINGN